MKDEDKNKKREEIRRLVIKRLEVLPSNKRISIGADREFSRDELIESIKKGDEVGDKIIEIQLEYLTSLKKGIFYDKEVSGHQTEV